jgi:tetratricopeptide (TPR) repeat protein
MKKVIFSLLVVALASCSEEKNEQITEVPKFNKKAVELNNKAVTLSEQQKLDSALLLYDQSIAMDSTYFLPHKNKIEILIKRKEFEKAKIESEAVIKLEPKMAEGWFIAGLIQELTGDTIKSKEYYSKSIDLYNLRIENPKLKSEINQNKLNMAFSKIFIGDKSYLTDYEEMKKDKQLAKVIEQIQNKTKEDIKAELLK